MLTVDKLTRDELANVLRAHAAEIKEADEWRPLAQHILDITDINGLIEKARAAVEAWRADHECRHMQVDPKKAVLAFDIDNRMYQLEHLLFTLDMKWGNR